MRSIHIMHLLEDNLLPIAGGTLVLWLSAVLCRRLPIHVQSASVIQTKFDLSSISEVSAHIINPSIGVRTAPVALKLNTQQNQPESTQV